MASGNPDPMTTAVWGTWIEINLKTAESLGISHGDLVEVESPAGSLRAPAVIYPAIRPEVVAMPVGQGHSNFGRYSAGRGVNTRDLLRVQGRYFSFRDTGVRYTPPLRGQVETP